MARGKWNNMTTDFKDKVAEYYKSHTFSNTMAQFKMPEYALHAVIEEYELPLRTRTETLRLAREQHYGSHENYVKAMAETIRRTSLEKYGTDNFAKSEEFRRKSKETCQTKYGVDNVMQSDAVKESYKKSCVQRLGVEWPMQSKEVLAKRTKTNEERYGGSGWASDVVKQRYQNTCTERYGVSNPMQCDAIKQHLSEVVKQKYGVEWFCMHQNARKYSSNISGPNSKFESLLKDANIEYEKEFAINRFSYDFKVGNILIEIDPAPTHNSTWGIFKESDKKPFDYHINKSNLAESQGFRCIHVWDWDSFDSIIRLIQPRDTVYARNCEVKEVPTEDSKEFLNLHHLQGHVKATVNLGLYSDGTLVSLMTFGKPRYNKNFEYELLRYCSSHYVIGGAEKLFAHFQTVFNPKSIISYCDNSKFLGNVYESLGFKFKERNASRHWYSMSTGKHITDNLLRQRGFDQLLGKEFGVFGKGTSNEELMRSHNFVEIWDAGQSTYIWENS